MPILICYDSSPSAKEAISLAVRTLASDQITLLHIWERPLAALADSFSDPGILANPSVEALERLAIERGQEILTEGHDIARALGLTVDERLEHDHHTAWQTILDVAHELTSEMIVLGTHGRTAVQQNLLGSVSAEVVHHSEIPVLIVPRPSLATGQLMQTELAGSVGEK